MERSKVFAGIPFSQHSHVRVLLRLSCNNNNNNNNNNNCHGTKKKEGVEKR